MRDRDLSREQVLAVADRAACRRLVEQVFALSDRLWTSSCQRPSEGVKIAGEGLLDARMKDWLMSRIAHDVDHAASYSVVLPWIMKTERHLHFRPIRLFQSKVAQ